jgi:hypothetical protein
VRIDRGRCARGLVAAAEDEVGLIKIRVEFIKGLGGQ